MKWSSNIFKYSLNIIKCQNAQSSTRVVSQSSTISNAAVTKRRLQIFEKEKERQKRLVTDIQKIQVQYRDQPDACTLMMNKNLSTPYDCARHMSKLIGDRAVLAEVDGEVWDMHRPLEGDVKELKFLHFQELDPFYVNRAFWRSCSLLLGSVMETAFKSRHYVQPCSFPPPNVRTGSFVYDIDIGMDWTPTKDELRVLSAEMVKLSMQQLPFERLSVPMKVALEMFSDNVYKCAQIPNIAQSNGSAVTVYRVGEYLDISCGPMMANSSQLGRVTVTAVHKLPQSSPQQPLLLRVQGVALPQAIRMNHYAYRVLEERAARMNEGRIPDLTSIGL